ncbi:MAG: hypothetical protein KFW07_04000 [Mycoplasmataceae bacterium]|nr:hypothetical protein [Mycoplasmataceae bacterium]
MYADLKRKYKKKGIVIGDSIYIWNQLKIKYLSLSIATGIMQIITLTLGITIIILVSNENTIYNTLSEYLASPALIILYIFAPIVLSLIFLSLKNRIIMTMIFDQENFSEKLSLKKNNWFFKSSINLKVYMWLHMSIVGSFLAIITYKDIEKNNKANVINKPL